LDIPNGSALAGIIANLISTNHGCRRARLLPKNDVDIVLLSGDIMDKKIPSVKDRITLEHGLSMMMSSGAEIYAIAGNHDGYDADGLCTMSEMEYRGLLTTVSRHKPCITKDISIYGMEWLGSSTIDGIVDLIGIADHNQSGIKLFMGHFGIEGLAPVLSPDVMEQDVLSTLSLSFNYVALGHIHIPYFSGNVVMPGSLEAINRGEVDRAGYVVIATINNDGTLSKEKIQVKRRPWNLFEFDMTGIQDEYHLLEEIEKISGTNDIVVIKLVGVRKCQVNRRTIIKALTSASSVQIVDETRPVVDDTTSAAVTERDYFIDVLGDKLGGQAVDVVKVLLNDPELVEDML